MGALITPCAVNDLSEESLTELDQQDAAGGSKAIVGGCSAVGGVVGGSKVIVGG